jgi:two-component system nitrate/nitrite response regulator NarL
MLQVDIDQMIQRARANDARANTKPLPSAEVRKPAPRVEPLQNAPTSPIRVLIADDHPVVRQGLTCCFNCNPQVQVVAEAADGQEVLRKVKEVMPDVVLMDVDMPTLDGLAATQVLRREHPTVKVLVLSTNRHPEYVLRILKSGASGFVLKDASPEQLVTAIKELQAGHTFFNADAARLALNGLNNCGAEPRNSGMLSDRERDVLIAIADGLSNKETASRLGIGVRTIETHRERIMRKLNIHSVAGLTRFAIANGLIVLG